MQMKGKFANAFEDIQQKETGKWILIYDFIATKCIRWLWKWNILGNCQSKH